jgi:hypothetical protein
LRFRRMGNGSCLEVMTRQSGCGIHTPLLNRHALSAYQNNVPNRHALGRFNVFFQVSIIVLGILWRNSRLSSKLVKFNLLGCGVSRREVGDFHSLHVLVQVIGAFCSARKARAWGGRARHGKLLCGLHCSRIFEKVREFIDKCGERNVALC